MGQRFISSASVGRSRLLCAAMTLLLGGCASINRETHYIKAVDGMGYPVNYYRVSVKGKTTLSSSRYLSGYFPEDAVDIYFGQIPQPKDGKFIEVQAKKDGSDSGTANKEAAESASDKPSAGPAPGTKLVLLLSSRAESVASGISDIARNEELMRNITKLIYRDEFEAARRASDSQRVTRSRLDALLTIGTSSIQELDINADAATAIARLLLFCNQVAFQFGNHVPFTTLQQASDWYEQNRDTLVGRPSRW